MQTLWSFLPSFPDQRVIAISRYIAIYIALGGTNQSINQSISDVYRVRATMSHGWGSCRRVSPEVARWDGCQGVCALEVGRGEKRWTGFPPGERNHET